MREDAGISLTDPGVFIESSLGPVTSFLDRTIEFCCHGDVPCRFSGNDGNEECHAHHCTGAIWVNRVQYAQLRLTR